MMINNLNLYRNCFALTSALIFEITKIFDEKSSLSSANEVGAQSKQKPDGMSQKHWKHICRKTEQNLTFANNELWYWEIY